MSDVTALEATLNRAAARSVLDRRPRGPGSTILRRGILGAMDGNSSYAKHVKAVAAQLTALFIEAHGGAEPTLAQRLLLDQAAHLSARLAQLNAQHFEIGSRASDQYARLNGTLTRMLVRLRLTDTRRRDAASSDLEAALAGIKRKRRRP